MSRSGPKGVKKSSPRPRVKMTVELADLDHLMLVAMANHSGKTQDQLIAEALMLLYVSMPREDDLAPSPIGKTETGFTHTVGSVACTKDQAEAIAWALDAMEDMAKTYDADYVTSDLPRLTSGRASEQRFLHIPSWRAVSDLLYRLEEQLPQMAKQDSNVRRPNTSAAKRAAAAIRKVAKANPDGRAALSEKRP